MTPPLPTPHERTGAALREKRLALGLSPHEVAQAIYLGAHMRCTFSDVLAVEAGEHARLVALQSAYRQVLRDAR